jgi:hypothetical protein
MLMLMCVAVGRRHWHSGIGDRLVLRQPLRQHGGTPRLRRLCVDLVAAQLEHGAIQIFRRLPSADVRIARKLTISVFSPGAE